MNGATNNHYCHALKEAWQKIHGMKRAFWGALSLLSLISIGGTTVLGIALYLGKAAYLPHLMNPIEHNPLLFLDPHFVMPIGMLSCFLAYHIMQTLFQCLILLPMLMGMRLIALRKVVDKSVSALFIFKFFTWKYISRFVALEVLVVLAVGIPLGLASFLAFAPKLYLLGYGLMIGAYTLSALFYLLSLYLIVSYAFINFIIIDRDISAWKTMELSRKMISKRWFCVFSALIWIAIVLVIGTALLLIGLIWAIPYTQNLIAILYRNMMGVEGKDPVTQHELNLST